MWGEEIDFEDLQINIVNIFVDEHFTEVERKWIERLQWFIEVYVKMFIITGIVYITSPNIFAAIQYAMDKPNATLFPETAKIECDLKDIFFKKY